MAKGYWVAQVDVADPEAYKAYMRANAEVFRTHGGRFLIRGGAAEVMEGQTRSRTIVIEFADLASALACYRSPEYTAAIALRADVSTADLVVIEGYDGPQPAD